MKRRIVYAVAVMIMAACSGGEFGATGKAFNEGRYKIIVGNRTECMFEGEPKKYGYVLDGKIALSPVFDNFEKPHKMKDGSIYFTVFKDGKRGVVKAFEKKYHVPCVYDEVNVFPDVNLLVLVKKDETGKTVSKEFFRLNDLKVIEPKND
jgi:hypothetical protein